MKNPVLEVALVFLKLGTIGFGGPAAHIGLMRRELVVQRKWLSDEEFIDLLGATNLIPGPNSTEMAIHIGYRRCGWRGLVLGGLGFIVPAALIVAAIAWAYIRFGTLPAAEGLLRGVKPVVIIVVFEALFGLARTLLKRRAIAVAAIAAVVLNLAGVHELLVLLGCGVALVLWRAVSEQRPSALMGVGLGLPAFLVAPAQSISAVGLNGLFLAFAKIGSVLFGSGYVLLAFLRADFVERFGWLTEAQLLDAVAVGQVTPGPVFTTATFIGYVLAGFPGAFASTAGIFLPAFVFVALSGPLVPRIRRSRIASAFLDGVNAASLALMAVVTWQLARAAVVDLVTVAIAVVAAVALLRFHVNVVWLIGLGAAVGYFGTVLRVW